MKKYKLYSDFEYRKILAILSHLKYEIDLKSDLYSLEITTFEEVSKTTSKILDILVKEESFFNIDNFTLLTATFYLEASGNPFFYFKMGVNICCIDFEDERGSEIEESWTLTLAGFIEVISSLISKEDKSKTKRVLN